MPNLLDLPAEIQLLIYDYTLPNGTILHIAANSDSRLKYEIPLPGITFASKQMYDETAPILFSRNAVELHADISYESFSRTMNQLAAMTAQAMLWMPGFDFRFKVRCPTRTVCPCDRTVAVCIRFDLKEGRFGGGPRYTVGNFRHERSCVLQGPFLDQDFVDRILRVYDLLWERVKRANPLAERKELVWFTSSGWTRRDEIGWKS
jgi:hypothetical protein